MRNDTNPELMKIFSPPISPVFLLLGALALSASLSTARGEDVAVPDHRPDLLVGDSRDPLAGDGTYLGGHQKIKIEIAGNTKFFVRVENDGALPDTIRMRGRKGNRHFEVNYFDESNGDTNITAELIGGRFVTAELATGEGIYIRGEVEATIREKPGKGKGRGKSKGAKRRHFKVSGASENDPAARDIVRAFVRTAKDKKPKKGKPGKP